MVKALVDSLVPNRARKFIVDLSTARSDKSLVEEGLLPSGKVFSQLMIMKVGGGVWSLKMKFSDGSTVEYACDEVTDGYRMERRFTDVLFTNASQTVTNPKFVVEWSE